MFIVLITYGLGLVWYSLDGRLGSLSSCTAKQVFGLLDHHVIPALLSGRVFRLAISGYISLWK